MKLRYLLSLSLLIPATSIECGILSRFTQSFRTWAPCTGAALGMGYWFTKEQKPENKIKPTTPSVEFTKAYCNIRFHCPKENNFESLHDLNAYDLLKSVSDIECARSKNDKSSCRKIEKNYTNAVSNQKNPFSGEKISAEQSKKLFEESLRLFESAEISKIPKKEAASFAKNNDERDAALSGSKFFGEGYRKDSFGRLEPFYISCRYGECYQYKKDAFWRKIGSI